MKTKKDATAKTAQYQQNTASPAHTTAKTDQQKCNPDKNQFINYYFFILLTKIDPLFNVHSVQNVHENFILLLKKLIINKMRLSP